MDEERSVDDHDTSDDGATVPETDATPVDPTPEADVEPTADGEEAPPFAEPAPDPTTEAPDAEPEPDDVPQVIHTAQGKVLPAAEAAAEETIPADEVRDPDRSHEHPDARPVVKVSLPPTLTLLLGLAAGVIAIAGLKQVASIVAPTFLAATLIIAVYPVYKLMRKILPGPLAGLLLITLLYGILAALGGSIGIAATRFANELAKPEYVSTFTGIATSLANAVTGLTTTMVFLLTVMIFLVMDAGGFNHRLAAIHRVKPDVADALVDFGHRVRKYWIVSTVFGLIVAAIDYVALVWLGVPLAMTFALLSFVTNYIPNVGFVLGLIPPAFIALLTGGVSTMVWVIVIYSVANFVIQTILQPKFTGDAVGINASTAFLSLVFWAYVFGALGALLAIPFTLLVKSLLIDRDAKTRWINPFISSNPRYSADTHPG